MLQELAHFQLTSEPKSLPAKGTDGRTRLAAAEATPQPTAAAVAAVAAAPGSAGVISSVAPLLPALGRNYTTFRVRKKPPAAKR